MNDYLEKILRAAKLAFAVFDQDFFLQDASKLLAQYAGGRLQKKSATLWEVFPELIGAEDKITELLEQKAKKYELEKLSRFDQEGKLLYYTLTLFSHQQSTLSGAQLIVLITDTTKETSLEQQIQQQKNEIRLLHAKVNQYNAQIPNKIYGQSAHIQTVRAFIDKIAPIKTTTILLLGESGTGKNLVANAIHQQSMDQNAPFIEINCASIPETLIESEIFGYERGAFTNALTSKKGLLEEADGGTLFLDEIGELPHPIQAKFLTFMETKRFRRLGSTREIGVQVRIITATNRNLLQAVKNNEFREDLFYRLYVVSHQLPPLRQLGDDILLLAEKFIEIYAYDFGKKVKGLSESAKSKLMHYEWPGNVRELRNVIERAVIFAEHEFLEADEIILFELRPMATTTSVATTFELPENGISLTELEKNLLRDAIIKSDGNQTKAAKLLDLSLDTFRYRIKKYNLDNFSAY
ncbi:MAG: sigma-54-dependent Fis family transcriptional regulator [Calditrichaeota bacterium]|nr:MAG: sigma-54-dependent Fis family transcriptional regulator [Calditrichota bacterium]